MPCSIDTGDSCFACNEYEFLEAVDWHESAFLTSEDTLSLCENCLRIEQCVDCKFSMIEYDSDSSSTISDRYNWITIETKEDLNLEHYKQYFCPLNFTLQGELATNRMEQHRCILFCMKCAQARIHKQFEVWRKEEQVNTIQRETGGMSLLESIGTDLTNLLFSYLEYPKSIQSLSLVCRRWYHFIHGNDFIIENHLHISLLIYNSIFVEY
jgi:hypothetical protein